MRTMRTGLRIFLIVAMMAPLTVSSTPPSLGPWHSFTLLGTVSHGDGSVANYTVVAMGKVEGTWRMLHSCSVAEAADWGGAQDIVLTGTGGDFYLSLWLCEPPDSIAAAVVLPDNIILGPQIPRTALEYTTYHATSLTTEDGFLCDHAVAHEYLNGYKYDTVEHLIVTVP
jgi:hypothetical protein